MAVTLTATYRLPQVVSQNNSVGTTAWQYPDEIKVSEFSTAPGTFFPDGCALGFATFAFINLVKAHLVVDGTIITAANKATNQRPQDHLNLVLGGTSDVWSATLTPEKVMSPDFGVAVAYGDEDTIGVPISYYLLAQDFGFVIPEAATISGVQLAIDHNWVGVGGGGMVSPEIDDMQVQITYSYEPVLETTGSAGCEMYVEDSGQPENQKLIRYFVYQGNTFIREWDDVASEIVLRKEINKALYNIDLRLARDPFNKISTTESVFDEDGLPILDEQDGLTITSDVAAALGLGTGTDVEVNHNVKIRAYYGKYEPILDEDGHPILDENYRQILTFDGAPDGKEIYSGFIQDWEISLGESDDVSVYLLNDAEELNNIMLETDETIVIDNTANITSFVGIAGSGTNDNNKLAQTFVMPSTKTCSRISFFAKSGWPGYVPTFRASLYSGGNPNSPTSLLAIGTVSVNEYLDYAECSFAFPTAITLTSGQAYTVRIETDEYKTGGGGIYPINFATNTYAVTGADGYVLTNDNFANTYLPLGADLAFGLWEAGLDTKVPFLSKDPSDIVKSIIDFARSRGAQINYTADSIEMTGTEVSYTFNANTITEALEKVLELCPTDWYWTYDPGTNLYSLKALSSTVQRKFTNKKDVQSFRLRKSLTKLVNQVYFTGGGSPALFQKTTDATSRDTYRPGLQKISDQRVTDSDTAFIMSQAVIDRYKDPIYVGTITITGDHPDPIESIQIGEKVGFLNYGELLDNMVLQISGLTYNLDTVTLDLGVILPRVPKRIEDIKRNLDVLSQVNNPNLPTE